ncbi:SusC/RagA family TonB-linked outer membrane protein [Persicitalea jodogahamensis]|uniref:SusC/RagA family TonB-linked outer membrane protein n=1 Tax=Persicitalea jodogahamensis TaxID=402147 RepID=A0A8J3D5S2_9BACT|nr:SusC/RagA family TonB-linked outer membrane protein [Persicitalea jodogahamensis]GHB77819.1 SusC/RagA family TonB-linked outer membrane protein [Persicitalea jodogahamensis]
MKKQLFTLLSILILSVGSVFGQDRALSGTINDENGQPLPGASVLLKGTTRGTNTNAEGNFTLNVNGAGTLTISTVGYATKELPFTASQTTVTTNLDTDVRSLGEVVVTALGITKEEKTLSYATQQIDTKTFSKAKELNVANSLIGRVAGLDVARSASGPGSSSRIVLRGDRSISGNNQALIVVDGVPMDNSNFSPGNANGGRDGGDGLSSVNPDDIEAMNILRGAAATALYGSRASNGAILITTKRGSSRKGLGVSINSSFMAEQPMYLRKLQNEYGQGSAGQYSPRSEFSWGPKMTGQSVALWGNDPETAGQTYNMTPQPNNYEDFYSTGSQLSNSLAVTGGNDKAQTYFSYTNVGAKGIVDNNKLKRNIFNLRLTNNLGSKLTLDSKITYLNEKIDNRQFTGEAFENLQRHVLRLPRNIRTEDAMNYDYIDPSTGKLRQNYWNPGSNGGQNPYWIKNRVLTNDQRDRITGFSSLKYQITPALSIMGRAGLDRYVDKYEGKYYNDTYTIADNGNYLTSWREISELNLDIFAIYRKEITPDFSIDATVGANRLTRDRLDQNTNNSGLNRDNLFITTNARSPQSNRSVIQTEKQGVFATADFTFKNAITLSASGRNDWSSTLPKDNQSYFYPSVGFSAVISSLVTLPQAVSFLKLRGTYAQTGNDAAPYLLNQTYTFSTGGPNGFISRDNVKPFPSLKPELTTSLEAGIQMKFFGDRIGFDLGYYTSDSKNQLFRVAIPPASGWSTEYINAGLVRNSGIELTFNVTPLRLDKLRWDIDVNYSANKNKLIELTPDLKTYTLAGDFMNSVRAIEGRPLGEVYSRGYERNDQGQILVDQFGLPRITSGTSVYMGNTRPTWIGGISNRISYGSFSLNFLISARIGGIVSSFSNAVLYADGIPEGTLEGRESYIFPGVLEDGTANNITTTAEKYWLRVGGRNTPAGEVFTYSASNIRLRELTLSYALPADLVQKSPFQGASLSLVGRNLFFLMNKADGFDPELTAGAQNTTVGLESFSLPSTRTIGVNLSLSF